MHMPTFLSSEMNTVGYMEITNPFYNHLNITHFHRLSLRGGRTRRPLQHDHFLSIVLPYLMSNNF
jgi:hypothetical protein